MGIYLGSEALYFGTLRSVYRPRTASVLQVKKGAVLTSINVWFSGDTLAAMLCHKISNWHPNLVLSNMASWTLSFESLEIGCKPSIN